MYTFSSKLKTFSFILMAIGVLGIGYGFLTAPKNIEEVEKILAASEHEGGRAEAAHEGILQFPEKVMLPTETKGEKSATTDTISKDSLALKASAPIAVAEVVSKEKKHVEVDEHAEHQEHLKHVLNQLQNKLMSTI